MEKRKGISLITLVVTIIVIIILAGAVIFAIASNNPTEAAREAIFKADLDTFRAELLLYNTSMYATSNGTYAENQLNEGTDTIGNIIKSLENNKKYEGKLIIEKGQLIFICNGTVEDEWAEEIGIIVKCMETQILISVPSPHIADIDTDVEYKITAISDYPITNVVEQNIKVYRVKAGIEESDMEITGILRFTYEDKTTENGKYEKDVFATIETESLINGDYYIKVLPDTVASQVGDKEVKNKNEVKSSNFILNNELPSEPSIVPSTTDWTNQDITVTITYYGGTSNIKKYIIGEDEWIVTTQNEVILTIADNTHITAVEIKGEAQSSSDYDITNIDKTPPEINIVGDIEMSVGQYSTYVDQGANATDDLSGISGSISVESNIDTNIIGTYNVTYSVSDVAGNMATNIRIVDVGVPSACTFVRVYKASASWTVPETGWYKIHVIGKGGNGGGGGDKDGVGGYAGGGGRRPEVVEVLQYQIYIYQKIQYYRLV